MKVLSSIALLAFSLAAFCGEAATTTWDVFTLTETDYQHLPDGSGCSRNTILLGSFDLQFDLKVYTELTDGYEPPTWGAFFFSDDFGRRTYTRFATAGETITVSGMLDPTIGGSCDDHRPIDSKTTDYYLALLSTDLDGSNPTLAWLSLTGTDDPHVTVNHTAVTDGDSLVVGAIPEPTSGLLLLVGSVLLLIRRRGSSSPS